MRQTPQIGENRTGTQAAPERARAMIDAPSDLVEPTSTGDGHFRSATHVEYASEGLTTGSIPGGEEISEELAPLIDKLGARLAFERAGTRLYDGLLAKHDAYGDFDGGPTRDELGELRDEELHHFMLVQEAIIELGGDPTSVTPSANLEINAGKGIGDVIGDPRTSLLEGLEAMVIAELADHESWEALIDIADALGYDELVEKFQVAHETEEEHLEKLRRWIAAGHGLAPTRH